MGFTAILQGIDADQIVRDVLGTRFGRRCYLARLDRTGVPPRWEADPRSLWAHWCAWNGQVKPTADERLAGLDLAKASPLRRWLWIWTGR